MHVATPRSSGIEGRVWRRGDEGYERARRGSVWHAGAPGRFPEVIVRANSTADVVAAIRLARDSGLQVAIRSGGHSWAASHLRDGSLLLDLSNLRRVEIDADSLTATAGPGITGWEFGGMLRERGLFFPTGHSEGIALGGYLLQGGFGWNSRRYGPACLSVTAIDVVTAEGELVHADEHTNAELLWAARGAGTGFFGVVVNFHLRLYPRATVVLRSSFGYPTRLIPDVLAYLHEIATATPIEIGAIIRRHELADDEPVLLLTGIAYTDSEDEARRELGILEAFPGRHAAIVSEVGVPMDFEGSDTDGGAGDEAKRWIADNMATHAQFDDLRPGLERMLASFPPAPSHILVFNWGGYENHVTRPSMAFSVDDDLFYGVYAAWDDPADDDYYRRWVTEALRRWEPHASGTMLADENLAHRPYDFMVPENLARTEEIRGRWDPDGRFVSWLGRPDRTA
jgi:FAD/FMN-containing dehydrogenase